MIKYSGNLAMFALIAETLLLDSDSESDSRKGYLLANRFANNNARFCFLKGLAQLRGLGTDQDTQSAVNTLRRALEMGDESAATVLGFLFDNGDVVAQDPVKAFRLYLRASLNGEVGAMVNLAACYAEGTGTDVCQRKALIWQRRARLCYACGKGRIERDPDDYDEIESNED